MANQDVARNVATLLFNRFSKPFSKTSVVVRAAKKVVQVKGMNRC